MNDIVDFEEWRRFMEGWFGPKGARSFIEAAEYFKNFYGVSKFVASWTPESATKEVLRRTSFDWFVYSFRQLIREKDIAIISIEFIPSRPVFKVRNPQDEIIDVLKYPTSSESAWVLTYISL